MDRSVSASLLYLEDLRIRLRDFAEMRDAEHKFPLVFAQLIALHSEQTPRLNLPRGKDVTRPGFDGKVRVNGSLHNNVPEGDSVWEIKATASFNPVKEDYEKRTKETPLAQRRQTTYVAVYCRKGTVDEDWIKECKESDEWREFRFYSLEELEDWITESPAVLLGVVFPILELKREGIRNILKVTEDFLYTHDEDGRKALEATLSSNDEARAKLVKWFTGEREAPVSIISKDMDLSLYFCHRAISKAILEDDFAWVFTGRDPWALFVDSRGIRETILIPIFDAYNYSTIAHERGYSLIIPTTYDRLDDVKNTTSVIEIR